MHQPITGLQDKKEFLWNFRKKKKKKKKRISMGLITMSCFNQGRVVRKSNFTQSLLHMSFLPYYPLMYINGCITIHDNVNLHQYPIV